VPAPPPCSQLLTPELIAFLHSGLASALATASADGVPAMTRAFAIRVPPDARTIDVFVGRAQSSTCLANLRPGVLVAAAIGNPLDYRGIQFKGTVVDCQPAEADDLPWIERSLALFEAKLVKVGMTPPGDRSFRCQEYVRVTFIPAAIFRQSPGPGAGSPLGDGPPWA
jgi:hypothetical protein